MAASIQIFGHSFVSRLKSFLRNEPHVHFNLNLTSPPLVQYSGYSGAKVETLRRNFTDITDFAPDIVLLLIGTNDLCQPDVDHVSVSASILDLIDSLLFFGNVKRMICCHRRPSHSRRHHVDTTWFNNRVDETNYILSPNIQELPHGRATFWRLKGFWSPEAQSQVFALDGVHLSVMGQKKLYSNIRAAVVATLNNI